MTRSFEGVLSHQINVPCLHAGGHILDDSPETAPEVPDRTCPRASLAMYTCNREVLFGLGKPNLKQVRHPAADLLSSRRAPTLSVFEAQDSFDAVLGILCRCGI